MRRGRPSKPGSEHKAPKPSPSPMRVLSNDPFGALDANAPSASTIVNVDNVSSRFPPLDEFSILHDSKSKFAFDLNTEPTTKHPKDISQRVTDALADDAFARPAASKEALPSEPKTIPSRHLGDETRNTNDLLATKSAKFSSSPKDILQRTSMVSTGTMTSPSPPSSSHNANSPHPIYRFPLSEHRSSSQSRSSDSPRQTNLSLRPDNVSVKRPGLLEHRSKTQMPSISITKSPVSSRPSLEGPRPSQLEIKNTTINRSKSASSRSRPVSMQIAPRKSLRSGDAIKGDVVEDTLSKGSLDTEFLPRSSSHEPEESLENGKISSNVAFLRAMEEEEPSKKKEKRLSSGSRHAKRASMPSISLSGTKSLLAGRFGEAFRRFETNAVGPSHQNSSEPDDRNLTPVAGSEATDGRSDDGQALDETEPISAEIRRELERCRLSQEEKRVSDAGAAYRKQFAENGDQVQGPMRDETPNSRAASIQSKVKSLLDENVRSTPETQEVAYSQNPPQPSRHTPQLSREMSRPEDEILRRPISHHITKKPPNTISSGTSIKANSSSNTPKRQPSTTPSLGQKPPPSTSTARYPPPNASIPTNDRPFPRPSAPPKPHALRTGNRDPDLSSSATAMTLTHSKTFPPSPAQPIGSAISPGSDDWEAKFSKRYPALAGLEMVETEVGSGGRKG